MTYKVTYDLNGLPCAITDGISSIPICAENKDFNAFLEWNSKQKEPLDWKTPIAVAKKPDEITAYQRLDLIEAALQDLILGG